MDIRKSEEFRKAHEAKAAKFAREEISARNILTNYHYLESLKAKVFEENAIGTLGFIPVIFLTTLGLTAYTMTTSFTRLFPRAARALGQSIPPRVVLILLSISAGRSYEQYIIEHHVAAEAYTEYKKAQDYYDSLKARRLETLGWEERLRLLVGVRLR
jgi:hypothetical protein